MTTNNASLSRQTSYVIAVHDQSDKFAFENSIEELEIYIKKFPDRKAIIISETYKNDNYPKIAYNQVQTFKKGTIRVVDKIDCDINEAIKFASDFLKNGIILLFDVNINEATLDHLLSKKNQDVIIHRREIAMHQESELQFLNLLQKDAKKYSELGETFIPDKNIYFRLHNQNDFKLNLEYLQNLIVNYDKPYAEKIFLAKYILNKLKIELARDLNSHCLEIGENPEFYIDPYWFRKSISNYIYINLLTNKIVNIPEEFSQTCQKEIVEYFKNNRG
jgi:hypothetical protein